MNPEPTIIVVEHARIEDTNIILNSDNFTLNLTIERAEWLWQELLNVCHVYRCQGQIEKVCN